MRFLYIAPRYHTNQIPIMKGLRERGDEVMFLAHYQALIEDYEAVTPIVLGYSPLYRVIDYIYVKIIHRRDPEAIVYKIAHGFPPIGKLRRTIHSYKPEVVILREKSIYSMVSYTICKHRHIPCILYNQNPAYELATSVEHKDLAHRIVDRFLPGERMTPVLGRVDEGINYQQTGHYIPFVAEPRLAPSDREYFAGDQINILCIGKYELRKHHLELLEVLERIRFDSEGEGRKLIHLTLVGEATNDFQKAYYKRVVDYVSEHNLDSFVTVLTNIPHKEMDSLFRKSDIYVLPSTGESASVSQLEAMSYSLPVICSDTNGTACYVESGVTGYRFRDKDLDDLEACLKKLLSDTKMIQEMGAAGYEAIIQKYNFESYFNGVMDIISAEKQL